MDNLQELWVLKIINLQLVQVPMPEWGNLDILKACGASDPGSNPGSGVIINSLTSPLLYRSKPLHAYASFMT